MKNIFDNYKFNRNTISIKNITSFFGDRIIDLFMHLPLSIRENKLIINLNKKYIDQSVTIDLSILKYETNFNKRSPYRVICQTIEHERVDILFFNMNDYQIKNYLKLKEFYRVSGRLQFINNNFQIIHPTNILKNKDFNYFDPFEPNYDLARKRINKKIFRKLVLNNLETLKLNNFPEEWILKKFKKKEWTSFQNAILQIHLPKTKSDLKRFEKNRKRLAFDEILSSYLTFYELKKKFDTKNKFQNISNFSLSPKIIKKLPFNLTTDQIRSLEEIKKDLKINQKMYRLLQGDVGSGKTIIALLIIADVIDNGYQSVIMVPTEILAKQHYEYFKNLLNKFNITVEIITGSTKNREKQIIYEKISNNQIDILIGTHSVYNSQVKFNNLGLIVIDEQHKFGVRQRINLLEKSISCNTLIMSATPIPRSLSFAIYGEISVSNIKSKPKGRKEVVTSVISGQKINLLIDGIKRKLNKNEQVFWILPHIESSNSDKENLMSRYEFLKKRFESKVEILHGKMNKDKISRIMNDFKDKKIMILVSTTVVEVGINIPDATLMIIEQSEKFGLAQLHQLRGRISRGSLQANCVLIHSKNLSEIAKQRLSILKRNADGFDIAEKDLYLRGAGDFFGTNQSGLPTWNFFKPHLDYALINSVKENSEFLVNNYELNNEKINFLKKTFYKKQNFKNFFSA